MEMFHTLLYSKLAQLILCLTSSLLGITASVLTIIVNLVIIFKSSNKFKSFSKFLLTMLHIVLILLIVFLLYEAFNVNMNRIFEPLSFKLFDFSKIFRKHIHILTILIIAAHLIIEIIYSTINDNRSGEGNEI